MNRIGSLLEALKPATAAPPVVEAAVYRNLADEGGHALFVPVHYEPNYAYPLIVWLHGTGDDERQLKRIMPLVSMRNYVAVGPRGTVEGPGDEPAGYDWSQSLDHASLAEHRVLSAVESACERYTIAPGRIFLAGFQTGGTMAFRIALEHPELFAGVLSIGGEFPRGRAPLRRLSEARRLRVLLASGRDSRDYPPESVCRDLRLFHTAGMAVNLRQYPCGDELTSQMLSDVDRWIMEQLFPSSALSASEASGLRRDEGLGTRD